MFMYYMYSDIDSMSKFSTTQQCIKIFTCDIAFSVTSDEVFN